MWACDWNYVDLVQVFLNYLSRWLGIDIVKGDFIETIRKNLNLDVYCSLISFHFTMYPKVYGRWYVFPGVVTMPAQVLGYGNNGVPWETYTVRQCLV